MRREVTNCVLLGCKSRGGLSGDKVRTACAASKLAGQKEKKNEYCSLEMQHPSEAVIGGKAKRRPFVERGKAEVSREETVKCTLRAAGVWVLTCKESFPEITSGRSYFQLG